MTSAQLVFLLIVFVIVCVLAWLGIVLFAPGALRVRLALFLGRADTGEVRAAAGSSAWPRRRGR
jgi:tight adherence protein C